MLLLIALLSTLVLPASALAQSTQHGGGSGIYPVRQRQASDPTIRQAAALTNIVISQVYGGGGNSGATYTNDFIELFNRGAAPVDLSGWSVQYASATGPTWQKTDLSGTVQPGQYYLIQEAAGSGGTTSLPTPDAIGTIAMSGTAGKVAVVNTATTLSGSCPLGGVLWILSVLDLQIVPKAVTPPALSNTTATIRITNGCSDTDDNFADFIVDMPDPHNTASPLALCTGPTDPSGVGAASPNLVLSGSVTLLTVAVTPGTNPSSTALTVIGDLSTIGGVAAQPFFDDGSNGDVTAGDNIFSYQATVAVAIPIGLKNLPITITDAEGRTGDTTVAVTVQSATASPQILRSVRFTAVAVTPATCTMTLLNSITVVALPSI
ncbi:MAG: lamin tail domain-containing protein [Caldilineaceae bacterium]